MSKINVLLITWNRLEYLKKSLDCYLGHHGNVSHTLVISDNGSTDGTREYLHDAEKNLFPQYSNINIKVRYFSKNFGKCRVINNFFRNSDQDSEHLGVVCDDVISTSGWVGLMSNSLDVFPELGIIGLNDGREWCSVTERSGIGVYFGDGFFWNDDCYMIRKCVILNELPKVTRWTYDRIVPSGYILMNIWGVSEGRFYSDIKSTKYQLGVTQVSIKGNLASVGCSDNMKRHSILVRRFFVKNTPKYWDLTSGLLEWEEGGVTYSFPDEPKDEIRCENFPDDVATPACQLDIGVADSDSSRVFSQEEIKNWKV